MTPRGLPKSHSQAPLFLYVPPVRLTWGPSSPRAIANAAGLLLGGDVASIIVSSGWVTLIEVNWRLKLTIQNGLFVP
jgi:hypothetical protein